MDRVSAMHWLWHGRSGGARTARAVLTPATWLFSRLVARRNARYDAGEGVQAVALPALSIGNLSVGGTGKTPMAAWCVSELARLGARPAIVLRGYGDDEWRVHELLSPGRPVVCNVDRVAGVAEAAARGADVAVLDDGFQHRRAARVIDLVLLSADAWSVETGAESLQLLPAGPWREPLSALIRASVAVVTVKAATDAQVESAVEAIRGAAPDVPVAVVALVAGTLWRVASDGSPPSETAAFTSLRGVPVGVLSAIGDPAAFESQLASATGALLRTRRFPDHHAFREDEITSLVASWTGANAVHHVVCTLKDAVKLAPLWPRAAPPLWYVSQTIEVRLGSDALQVAFGRTLAARGSPYAASRSTAG